MRKNISRFVLVSIVMLAMMTSLIYKLSTLTIAQGAELSEQADGRKTRTIAIKGTRGSIMDRNGVVLAYSKTCYNVEFLRNADNRSDYDSAVYTEALIKTIEIVEAGGGTTIDTSYIRMNKKGELYYDWRVESKAAQTARYKNFRESMNFKDEDITAEEAYILLRRFWYIPEEMTFEQAVKVISIRQEVNLNNYRAYEPITIAYDVSMDVVAEINMHADQLPGVQTSQSTTRVYPKGETAAHVVGYLSRSVGNVTASYLKALGFSEADYQGYEAKDNDGALVRDDNGNQLYDMQKMGYSYDDYVGVSGVESTMESFLTGATYSHQGSREVEINKNGSIIREVSNTSASDGSDVMLTIDIALQVKVEEALKNLIEKIAAEEADTIAQDKDGEYTKATDGDLASIETAKTGAAVILDVNSGQVLAMASYPSYDPNWFLQGFTDEQYETLFGESAAGTTPMRNKAISARLAPGSVFKMCTGIAGVTTGAIGLNELIDDEGVYYVTNINGTKASTGPRCWTKYPSNHQNQNLKLAIQNSCNYYFYTVSERMGVKTLEEWAGKFGLTSSTGIELTGESVGIIGGQKVLFDNELLDGNGELSISGQKTSLPSFIYRKLCERLREIVGERAGAIDEASIRSCALALMTLQDGDVTNKGPQIRSILSTELGIPEGVTMANSNNYVSNISSMLNEIQWKPSQTIRTGIGQGVELVTPIAVARYAAAIANQGTVYQTHVVDRILDSDGKLVKQVEPEVFNQLNEVSQEVWTAVHEGMEGVVSPEDGGTAADKFSPEFGSEGKNYLSLLAGKTGTAQVGSNTIDIENTSWFVSYTPKDDPEIAIVICVPNGYSGSSSASAIEEIVTYYYDKQNSAAPENLVDINAVAP